jgi:hypothetical protein
MKTTRSSEGDQRSGVVADRLGVIAPLTVAPASSHASVSLGAGGGERTLPAISGRSASLRGAGGARVVTFGAAS